MGSKQSLLKSKGFVACASVVITGSNVVTCILISAQMFMKLAQEKKAKFTLLYSTIGVSATREFLTEKCDTSASRTVNIKN